MLYHVLFRLMYTKLAKVYYRLRRRHNQTPSTIFSTAVTMSLFWAPKELSELPEMRFKVPFNLIGKLTTAFLTGQSQRIPSSETQGQIMEPRESLNGRENMARRKVKNGQKSPGDNVLPDQFQMVTAVLASDWCQKTFVFFCPIRSQNGGDRLDQVW